MDLGTPSLIGGRVAVALEDQGLSVATLVGFITLFGIATRNGALLVSHYGHLMHDEGLPLREAVSLGSRERVAPALMTALTAGLALIPNVLAGGKPGNEIQSPMAEVILGGLLSSRFLTRTPAGGPGTQSDPRSSRTLPVVIGVCT